MPWRVYRRESRVGFGPGGRACYNPLMKKLNQSRLWSASHVRSALPLTELAGNAQAELASRARQRRKDIRSQLEPRVAGDGYALGDIFRSGLTTPRADGSVGRCW